MKQPIDLHLTSRMQNGSYILSLYDKVSDLTIESVVSKEFDLLMMENERVELLRQIVINLIDEMLKEMNK